MNDDEPESAGKTPIPPRNGILSGRQELMAREIAAGRSNVAAYRIAYNKPKSSPKTAGNAAFRILQNQPAIADRVKELQGRLEIKTLLTVGDRLAIAARIAQEAAAPRRDKLMAVEVYNRLAGDYNGGRDAGDVPLPIGPQQPGEMKNVTPVTTKREKVAHLRALIAARTAPITIAVAS